MSDKIELSGIIIGEINIDTVPIENSGNVIVFALDDAPTFEFGRIMRGDVCIAKHSNNVWEITDEGYAMYGENTTDTIWRIIEDIRLTPEQRNAVLDKR